MTTDYTGFCKWLYDWQTLIVGLLALGAGVAAYRAARRQARAAEEGIRQLQRETKRNLARQVIVATRLIDGVLSRMGEDIARLTTTLSQHADDAPMLHEYTALLNKPQLSVVWDTLGFLPPDSITNYLNLDSEIEQFKALRIIGCGWFKKKLQEFSVTVESLRDLVGNDGKMAHATILATKPSDR